MQFYQLFEAGRAVANPVERPRMLELQFDTARCNRQPALQCAPLSASVAGALIDLLERLEQGWVLAMYPHGVLEKLGRLLVIARAGKDPRLEDNGPDIARILANDLFGDLERL
jgi:hypothetical protein